MKIALTLAALSLSAFVFGAAAPVQVAPGPAPKGHLLVVGGGGTTDAIVERAFQLCGGKEARMLIVPQASSAADAGEDSKKFWVEKGAKNATVLDLADEAQALDAIAKADFIWMPGGDQSRLMEALAKTKAIAAIRKRYEEGALVGGTSAGAAVISPLMMIGGDKADLTAARAGGTQTTEGLALWPEVVVDQHFFKRQRFNRLLACVLDHPDLVGVGIDEKTAVVVSNGKCEVVGESSVLVLDARLSVRKETKSGETLSATNLRMQVLRAGDTFDLAHTPK
jgi:cyanophycinase